MEMNSDDEKPAYTGLPTLLIGRAGRQLLRQQESLRRPGEEAAPARFSPAELAGRVSRRGRGFRSPNFAPTSPPRAREPSPPQTPTPPRRESPPPGYLQLACVTAPPMLPPARMQQIATLPLHRAGSSRPGCWNCVCFGHSWLDCWVDCWNPSCCDD